MVSTEYKPIVSVGDLENGNADKKIPNIQVYKYRWVMLMLYGLSMAYSAKIYTSLYNISDIMCQYYGVSKSAFLIPSTVSNIITILMLFPAGFILSKYGIRFTVIIGSGVLALCAAIFVMASCKTGYNPFLTSLALTGISFGLMPQIAPEISAVWFPSNQHTLATNISLLMQSIGVGLSYVETIALFNNINSFSESKLYFRIHAYIYLQSLPCILIFFLNLVFFKDKPDLPPTMSQAKQKGPGKVTFKQVCNIFIRLLEDQNFIILTLIFSLNYAHDNVYGLVLNSLLISHYKNVESKVGITGLVCVFAATVGSVMFSIILDKTKQYKLQLFSQLLLSLPLSVGFTMILLDGGRFLFVCLLIVVNCLIHSPTLGIIAEIIAEVVYPVNVNTAMVFCLFLGNILFTLLSQLSGWLLDNHREKIILWAFVGLTFLQILLLFCVRVNTKRSNVDNKNEEEII